jgi:hypothetical protein
MKDLLGWETDEGVARANGLDEHHLVDLHKNKVWLLNNVINRPIYPDLYAAYMQEQLNGRWQLNGEPIIIGQYGSVLDGQHQGIALVLANQEVERHPDKWMDLWPDQVVTINKLVVFGIEETDEVINSMNTGKPRSLADVIYRSPYFSGATSKSDRILASKMAANAIKRLWKRMGMHQSFMAPRRTHSEATNFLNLHPRLLQAVRHIMTEYKATGDNGKSRWQTNSQIISPGYAAAYLYLMGVSATDGEMYHHERRQGEASENHINFDNWDKACEFWTKLAKGDKSLGAIHRAIAKLSSESEAGGTVAEKTNIVFKAWHRWFDGGKVDANALTLHYETKDDGTVVLLDHMVIEGIDLGDNSSKEDEEAYSGADPSDEPAGNELEEIEARKAAAKAAKDKEIEESNSKEEKSDGSTPRKPIVKPKGTSAPGGKAAKPGSKKPAAEEQSGASSGIGEVLNELHTMHPGKKLFIYNRTTKDYSCWGEDALKVGKLMHIKVPKVEKGYLPRLSFDINTLMKVMERFAESGWEAATIDGSGTEINLAAQAANKTQPKGGKGKKPMAKDEEE